MADAELGIDRGISVEEYASALTADGVVAVTGASRTCWRRNEAFSLEREPTCCLHEASAAEVRGVLWRTRTPVATYVRQLDATHPQNAWLYVCRNQNYSLDSLDSAGRRDARRALRAFRFEFIDEQTLLLKGLVPFCDARARVGLSDGTPRGFHAHFAADLRSPAHRIVAAWKDDTLAAFLSLLAVEDWVTIAAFSATEHLKFCPNNGLIHFALDYFLTQRKFRIVTYGLSSIQEVSKADSLHHFKYRVGFEILPVHRAFVFHPLLRPLANRMTLGVLRTCTHLRPRNRTLRKATGLLATYLNERI